jgi:hypothetical protein
MCIPSQKYPPSKYSPKIFFDGMGVHQPSMKKRSQDRKSPLWNLVYRLLIQTLSECGSTLAFPSIEILGWFYSS